MSADYLTFLFQITLRVKESEVQCLKQEITSLKDELQSAQKVRLANSSWNNKYKRNKIKCVNRRTLILSSLFRSVSFRRCSRENDMNNELIGFSYITFQDKRNATKKYKDMFTELSVVRAKTEREMDELRENLRLAHRALGDTSP